MARKGKKDLVYEGFTLPSLTIKKMLASNARQDSELKTLHKQLDRKKEELESDFSKTRSQLLSRALDHQMVLEGQSYDSCSSDEEQCDSEFENSADNHITSWETTSFSTLKDSFSSRDALGEDSHTYASSRNPRHKQLWADKVAHFEQSITAKNEPFASTSQPKRKITWGGRANPYMENWDAESEHFEQSVATKTKPVENVSKTHNKRKISWGGRANVYMENWDTRSVLSKASSEENLSSEVTCMRGDAAQLRVRKHSVRAERSRSFNDKSSGLTKEALQKHSSSTSTRLRRRHTVCSGPKRDKHIPTVEESCPIPQKPLSDLLPPIILPPIYLQETKNSKRKTVSKTGTKKDKRLVNTHVKNGVNESIDTKCSNQDLSYCRYLRIKRTDSEEYPW